MLLEILKANFKNDLMKYLNIQDLLILYKTAKKLHFILNNIDYDIKYISDKLPNFKIFKKIRKLVILSLKYDYPSDCELCYEKFNLMEVSPCKKCPENYLKHYVTCDEKYNKNEYNNINQYSHLELATRNISDEDLIKIFNMNKNIYYLSISFCRNITDFNLISSNYLKTLKLSCLDINDHKLIQILKNNKSIEYLYICDDVYFNQILTLKSIGYIINNFNNLKYVYLPTYMYDKINSDIISRKFRLDIKYENEEPYYSDDKDDSLKIIYNSDIIIYTGTGILELHKK